MKLLWMSLQFFSSFSFLALDVLKPLYHLARVSNCTCWHGQNANEEQRSSIYVMCRHNTSCGGFGGFSGWLFFVVFFSPVWAICQVSWSWKCCENNKHFGQKVAGEIRERSSVYINRPHFIKNFLVFQDTKQTSQIIPSRWRNVMITLYF